MAQPRLSHGARQVMPLPVAQVGPSLAHGQLAWGEPDVGDDAVVEPQITATAAVLAVTPPKLPQFKAKAAQPRRSAEAPHITDTLKKPTRRRASNDDTDSKVRSKKPGLPAVTMSPAHSRSLTQTQYLPTILMSPSAFWDAHAASPTSTEVRTSAIATPTRRAVTAGHLRSLQSAERGLGTASDASLATMRQLVRSMTLESPDLVMRGTGSRASHTLAGAAAAAIAADTRLVAANAATKQTPPKVPSMATLMPLEMPNSGRGSSPLLSPISLIKGSPRLDAVVPLSRPESRARLGSMSPIPMDRVSARRRSRATSGDFSHVHVKAFPALVCCAQWWLYLARMSLAGISPDEVNELYSQGYGYWYGLMDAHGKAQGFSYWDINGDCYWYDGGADATTVAESSFDLSLDQSDSLSVSGAASTSFATPFSAPFKGWFFAEDAAGDAQTPVSMAASLMDPGTPPGFAAMPAAAGGASAEPSPAVLDLAHPVHLARRHGLDEGPMIVRTPRVPTPRDDPNDIFEQGALYPISTPREVSEPFKVVAIGAYAAEDVRELSFCQGDILLVDFEDPGGWWQGRVIESLDRSLEGRVGWFPYSYVKRIQPVQHKSPPQQSSYPGNQSVRGLWKWNWITGMWELCDQFGNPLGGVHADPFTDEFIEEQQELTRKLSGTQAAFAHAAADAATDDAIPAPRQRTSGKIYARAFADYAAMDARELSLLVGDILQVTQQDDSGWWEGISLREGIQGWFPSTFVQICDPDTATALPGDAAITMRNLQFSLQSLSQINASVSDVNHPDAGGDAPVYVAIIANFHASDESELSLQAGDCVQVLQQDASGWWLGRVYGTDREGWFPSTFAEPWNAQATGEYTQRTWTEDAEQPIPA